MRATGGAEDLLDRGFSWQLIWEDENRWVQVRGVESPTALVEADASGRQLDIHVLQLVSGGPAFPLCDVPWIFDDHSLGGTPVACVSAATQVQMHTGYLLPLHHRRDVERLGELLSVPRLAGA